MGGVPMPNIPQMGSVWTDLGQAWVQSTKGAGAIAGRVVLQGGGTRHRRQDRLVRELNAWAPLGAPHSLPTRDAHVS